MSSEVILLATNQCSTVVFERGVRKRFSKGCVPFANAADRSLIRALSSIGPLSMQGCFRFVVSDLMSRVPNMFDVDLKLHALNVNIIKRPRLRGLFGVLQKIARRGYIYVLQEAVEKVV